MRPCTGWNCCGTATWYPKQNFPLIKRSKRAHRNLHGRASQLDSNPNLRHQTSNILHLIMNIGFVGVGRMGANMARRLKDRDFHVTSVYDTNRAVATELASELGCAAAQDLSEVTAASDVIFTVVTDDSAIRQIFAGSGDNLLVNARDKLFVN